MNPYLVGVRSALRCIITIPDGRKHVNFTNGKSVHVLYSTLTYNGGLQAITVQDFLYSNAT